MMSSITIPLQIPALPLPVPRELPPLTLLPDVDAEVPLEAWLYGATYLSPAMAYVMRNMEKYEPFEMSAIGLGYVPAALPGAFMVLSSKLFAPNFKDPLSQLGFDIISIGTIDNNQRLQDMLQATGIPEFSNPGWIAGLTKFRELISDTIKFDVNQLPAVPYISIGVQQLDTSAMTQQQQFEYAVYYCDMVWIEYQINLARQAFPPVIPLLDSTLASYSIVNSRYGAYIASGAAASAYATKQLAKTMFVSDSEIYHGLWSAFYENDEVFRTPGFVAGVNKLSELLQVAAMNTGV